MICPNGCSCPYQKITIDVDEEDFLKIIDKVYEDREGVLDVHTQTRPSKAILTVDPDPYETDNYFEGRRAAENSDAIVTDLDGDKVEIFFDCYTVVRGNKCLECETVFHPTLGDISENEEIDVNEDMNWIFPASI